MTKEEEAILNIKIFIKSIRSDLTEESKDNQKLADDIETVLNMLKEKDEEIEKLKVENENVWKLNANMSQRHLSDIFRIKKKDKQIDLMAKYINKIDVSEDFCEGKTMCDENCENCIKQYFKEIAERKNEE